jgi:hypothetical protein
MVICGFIYTPQLEQLVELQPEHEEAPAEALTVSPPLPLLTNPHEDINRFTFILPQEGHAGLSLPRIRISNFLSHFSQLYS